MVKALSKICLIRRAVLVEMAELLVWKGRMVVSGLRMQRSLVNALQAQFYGCIQKQRSATAAAERRAEVSERCRVIRSGNFDDSQLRTTLAKQVKFCHQLPQNFIEHPHVVEVEPTASLGLEALVQDIRIEHGFQDGVVMHGCSDQAACTRVADGVTPGGRFATAGPAKNEEFINMKSSIIWPVYASAYEFSR